MSHETPPFVSRFYYRLSAGAIICGEGLDDKRFLSLTEVREEFRWHRNKNQIERPTALVSTSSNILRTISGAFAHWRKWEEEGVRADEIFIAFMRLPLGNGRRETKWHWAKDLAQELGDEDANLYASEYVFEWEIIPELVMHEVSLQTLLNRAIEKGIWDRSKDWSNTEMLNTTLSNRAGIGGSGHKSMFEAGISMGVIAKCFGAERPFWILRKVF